MHRLRHTSAHNYWLVNAFEYCTFKPIFARLLRCLAIRVTRNTFFRTWYLPHSHVHNERTVPMAGCMAHERKGYISTSGLKSDVTVVFLDPDFFTDAKISAIRP